MQTIITIAREYGSGGRIVGDLVAKRLGIPCLDKSIVYKASEEDDISEQIATEGDEQSTNLLSYNVPMGGTLFFGPQGGGFSTQLSFNDKVFLKETEIIKEAADKGGCVIVGRCGGFILKDRKKLLRVFVHANLDDRINRVLTEYKVDVNEKKIVEFLKKKDKQRAAYHNFYTDEDWAKLSNYDLCISTSTFGIEGAVKVICDAANHIDSN